MPTVPWMHAEKQAIHARDRNWISKFWSQIFFLVRSYNFSTECLMPSYDSLDRVHSTIHFFSHCLCVDCLLSTGHCSGARFSLGHVQQSPLWIMIQERIEVFVLCDMGTKIRGAWKEQEVALRTSLRSFVFILALIKLHFRNWECDISEWIQRRTIFLLNETFIKDLKGSFYMK